MRLSSRLADLLGAHDVMWRALVMRVRVVMMLVSLVMMMMMMMMMMEAALGGWRGQSEMLPRCCAALPV